MTQEEKELLLKDLCARLPHGVKVKLGDNPNIFDLEYRIKFAVMYGNFDKLEDILDITNIKPYLFPLSSMTEEQKEEYYSLADDVTLNRGEGSYFGIKIHCIKLGISDNPHEGVWDDVDLDAIDWLNKNHFDYRGLIPMGLAIDATGLNIY
jgi:hypothetical protein